MTGALVGAGASADGGELARRPNIVLCMADDQGWGDMGYCGHPHVQTPHFDDLARTGLRFDRFYAAAPVCSPTRGSVMTGRHPNRFGCFKWGYPLRPQEITVAQALGSAGYVTGHFGKWHLGSVRKGSPVNPGAFGFDEWLSAENFYDNDPILSHKGDAVRLQGESSMIAVDAALEFIEAHAGGPSPFLAVVWFGSPHLPHIAAEEDRALYEGLPEAEQHFLGEITGMDRAFGKLRAQLDRLGLRESTLLWYCSDNGGLPGLGATGGRKAKASVYEGGLRVPALMEWPGAIPAPRRTSVPCVTSDIMPTILELAGVRPPDRPLDGVSLGSLVTGLRDDLERPIGFWDYPVQGISTPSDAMMAEVLQAQSEGHEPDDPAKLRLDAGEIREHYAEDRFPGHSAWLKWPWKLHRIESEEGEIRLELYDLHADPLEEVDRARDMPTRARSMRRSMESWLASVVHSLNGGDYEGIGPGGAPRG